MNTYEINIAKLTKTPARQFYSHWGKLELGTQDPDTAQAMYEELAAKFAGTEPEPEWHLTMYKIPTTIRYAIRDNLV